MVDLCHGPSVTGPHHGPCIRMVFGGAGALGRGRSVNLNQQQVARHVWLHSHEYPTVISEVWCRVVANRSGVSQKSNKGDERSSSLTCIHYFRPQVARRRSVHLVPPDAFHDIS